MSAITGTHSHSFLLPPRPLYMVSTRHGRRCLFNLPPLHTALNSPQCDPPLPQQHSTTTRPPACTPHAHLLIRHAEERRERQALQQWKASKAQLLAAAEGQARKHARLNVDIDTVRAAHTHAYTYTHMHAHVYPCMLTRTHMHAHRHAHMQAYIHTHARSAPCQRAHVLLPGFTSQ